VTTHTFTRAVTIVAVGFLLLNAALLAIAGYVIWAVVCAVAAGLAVFGWFWYRRAIAELADEREAMKREVESLRDLLHTDRRS
jgi:cell division protein FtsB